MNYLTIGIDCLIDLVQKGGSFKTGLNIYGQSGTIEIGKDLLIERPHILKKLKKNGYETLPVSLDNINRMVKNFTSVDVEAEPDENFPENHDEPDGEIFLEPMITIKTASFVEEVKDEPLPVFKAEYPTVESKDVYSKEEVEALIASAYELRKDTQEIQAAAAATMKNTISEILKNKGKFDIKPVEQAIGSVIKFILKNKKGFAHITRELISLDDYIAVHMINTCILSTSVLFEFNEAVADKIVNPVFTYHHKNNEDEFLTCMGNYSIHAMYMMAMGFFLHDVGKITVPKHILNKNTSLSPWEYEIIKSHSFKKGKDMLIKNGIVHPIITNIVQYHHAPLYDGDENSYPDVNPNDMAPYVKICRLADMYDAMISRRPYREAINPALAITKIIRSHKNCNDITRKILSIFLKMVGIYPEGSILYLKNGQMCYVIDSSGPIVVPFTDTNGKPLKNIPEGLNLKYCTDSETGREIELKKTVINPGDAMTFLPSYLKDMICSIEKAA